jgi:hypothetical protein
MPAIFYRIFFNCKDDIIRHYEIAYNPLPHCILASTEVGKKTISSIQNIKNEKVYYNLIRIVPLVALPLQSAFKKGRKKSS